MAKSSVILPCAPSEAVIAQVRAETGPKTLLSFSRGKDAIGAYLSIRDHFEPFSGLKRLWVGRAAFWIALR